MAEDLQTRLGTTFSAFETQPEATASLDFTEFVNTVLKKLHDLKDDRFNYYEKLRKTNSRWANYSRRWLSILAALAFLSTALAAALRFTDWAHDWDKYALLFVLAIYAVMGTINVIEKGTTKTSDYFRHLKIILSIRDLWSRLQFALLDEALRFKKADKSDLVAEATSRARIVTLAEAFCNDLNKISTSELSDWQSGFMASLNELADVAKKGADEVSKRLDDAVKAAEKAATDAKIAADSASLAAKPGAVNVTIAGDFDGEVAVSVDGAEKARSTGRSIAIESIQPGIRKFSAHASKAGKTLDTSVMVDVKSGLQALPLKLE